ncbi:HD-GYP domain-containing protein [Oxalobacteraceae bacterium CAVE-383]|nr:HD-GYP domain-containing protein [Oxalobacteraceae bacterium CAVE-383]
MLKRIKIQEVRLGMYLQELGGPWIDHPFWRTSFVLEKKEDLQTLLSGSIGEVVIDTSKGLDILAEDAEAEDAEEGGEENDSDDGDDGGDTPAVQVLAKPPRPAKLVEKTTAAQEKERASKVLGAAKVAITSMFEEVRMGRAVDAADVLPLVEEINASVTRNIGTLIGLARLKTADDYTYMHSIAVCALMVALGRECGMSSEDAKQAGLAGLLHDIGKMAVPKDILQKPGKLTQAEYLTIKNHPMAGYEMLRSGRNVSRMALDVVRHHHEKVDGTGYPDALSATQISLPGKMAAVCDVYDAITSNRPYKHGWEPGESLRRMAEWNNAHFDNHVFHAFVKIIGIYPVGSLVRMKSGKLGVVVDHNPVLLLQPTVKLFFSIASQARIPIEVIDLAKPSSSDMIMAHEDPAKWGLSVNDVWR